MSARLAIDKRNQLVEESRPERPARHPALEIPARIISVLFHPIFVPVYVVYFMINIHESLFASFTSWGKTKVLIMAFLMYGFFPIVTVLLLKALGFVDSIMLKTRKDRIIPFVACIIWYFWIWHVWRNIPEPGYPRVMVLFAMAVFLTASAGFMANIYMKVSMHSLAVGTLLGFIMYMATSQGMAYGLYLSTAILIAGVVCTARLLVSDHTQKEIYVGLLIGAASVPVASYFT